MDSVSQIDDYRLHTLKCDRYRIASVLKVETDIITSIAASLILTDNQCFDTDVIVYINNIIMFLMLHWLTIFSIRVSSMILKIPLREFIGKMSINYWYYIIFTRKVECKFANSCLLTIHEWESRILIGLQSKNYIMLLYMRSFVYIRLFEITKTRTNTGFHKNSRWLFPFINHHREKK